MTLAKIPAPYRVMGEVTEDPFTQEEYVLLRSALERYRDILLIKCLRATGLRIAEMLSITPEQIEENGPDTYLLIRRGKKRTTTGVMPKWEKVYLPRELGLELRQFMHGNRLASGQPIWGVKARQVRNILAAAGLKAIGRRIHPHEFRHLYIKTLIDAGLPAEAAAKMVGHASSKTTEEYYYRLTAGQQRDIQQRIPV